MLTTNDKDRFLQAYIASALWSSTDAAQNDTPMDQIEQDLSDETRAAMKKDCDTFVDEHWDTIENAVTNSESDNYVRAGHDFWLSRCGHGCGFWDGDWDEPAATILDKASKKAGNVDLYVGDDKQIWSM